MLAFISFLLVVIGCANWFCIGILQFDFVAGIFGSQSNIFSRLIYTLVGIASIIMVVNFIMNKGKFVVSFKKAGKEFEEYKEEKKMAKRRKATATESADDFSDDYKSNYEEDNYTEASTDMGEHSYQDKITEAGIDAGASDCNCKKNCECSEENNCGCKSDNKNPTGSNRAGNKRN